MNELQRLLNYVEWFRKAGVTDTEILDYLVKELSKIASVDNKMESDKQSEDIYISQLLSGLGISPKLVGFAYLKTAIYLIKQDSNMLNYMHQELYPAISKMHNSTVSRVESGIRSAIKSAWEKRDSNITFFRYFNDKRPTNVAFLRIILDFI